MAGPYPLIAAVLGYLFGSIPFGLLLTRLTGYGDIRGIGSGNIGATNVLRTGNKGLAALTLLLDLAKGTAAVVVARQWGPEVALVAACCVILGHMFPIWLGFRGGKGVATALGVLIPLAWPVAIVAALIADKTTAFVIAGIALLIILRHHANIRRLIAGTESRISFRKS